MLCYIIISMYIDVYRHIKGHAIPIDKNLTTGLDEAHCAPRDLHSELCRQVAVARDSFLTSWNFEYRKAAHFRDFQEQQAVAWGASKRTPVKMRQADDCSWLLHACFVSSFHRFISSIPLSKSDKNIAPTNCPCEASGLGLPDEADRI